MVRLDVSPLPLRARGSVRWTFTVANTGTETEVLAFASAQLGDVVLESGGDVRYRWSEGRVFAAVIGERALVPGESWTFALDGHLTVEPGRYTLVATVAGRPVLPSVRGEVDVEVARSSDRPAE